MPMRPLHILLVQDDDVDIECFVRGLRPREGQQSITVARNGLEALAQLRGQNGQAPRLRPSLIITDLDMPEMNGLEFLRELRQDPQLRQFIVFVLTNSESEADLRAAYNQQIAGYLLKAKVTANFSLLLNLITCYQEHVEFPP